MTDREFHLEYGHHLAEEVCKGRMTRRQLLVRASVFGLSVTTIGSIVAACGGASHSVSPTAASGSTSMAKSGGMVRVATSSVLSAFDPVTMYEVADVNTVQQICEYLVWAESDLSLRPVLAQSWSSDTSAKVWTFKLRRGVKFNDGSDFGADDVVATFERLVDPKSGSSALSAFKGVLSPGGTVKVDDGTVAFHLDRAFVDFPYLVSSGNYNAVILPKNFNGDFLKRPVGTGPFMLISYQTQYSSMLRKNPNYWQRGLPYLEGVEFAYNSDVAAQVLGMQSGNVDVMSEVPFQGAQALFNDANVIIQKTRSTAMDEVAMRVDEPPFTDKRVRQAIAYCLDRPGLIEDLYGGGAVLGNDEVFAPMYPNSPQLSQRGQDYARAKSLLGAAGYPNGLSATITVPSAFLDLEQYATLIQAMCKPVGIDIKINAIPETAFYNGAGSSAPWLSASMDIVDWTPRPAAAQFIQAMLLSSSMWNSSHWANPQFDRLTAQYNGTIDHTSRSKLAAQMAILEQDETPVIIAAWQDALRAMSTKLRDVQGQSFCLDLSKTYWA